MKMIRILTAASFLLSAVVAVVPASAVDSMDDWKRAVAKKIATKQTYPRSALTREIEGRAEVRLVVSGDGTITAHEILKPTGEKVLDREIPKLVGRLNPLPALPSGQSELSFVLPLNWALD